MAREPIRWDNVGLPQFNNSALAVSAGAFGQAGEQARLLTEAFQKQELENRAKAEQDALNAALTRAYADNQITPDDFQHGAGLGTAFYDPIQKGLMAKATLDESAAATRASNASTDFDRWKLNNAPSEWDAERKRINAETNAANLTGKTQAELYKQIADERSRAGEEYTKGQQLEGRIEKYSNWRFGEGEGSINFQADQQFPQALQELAVTEAKKYGKTPEELINSFTPEEIEERKRQHRLDYSARVMQSEDAPDQIYRATGLSPTEQAQYTLDGQRRELDENALRESQANLATQREADAQQRKEWITAAQNRDNTNIGYDGAGGVSWITANNTGKDEAKILAKTKYSLDDANKVELVRSVAPNKAAFENALLEVTDSAGWTDSSTKRKFPSNFQDRLNKVRDNFLKAAGAELQGPDAIQTGTPVENLRTNLQAAWSGKFNTPEKPGAEPQPLDTEVLKKQITAVKTDVTSLVEGLPDQLKKDPEVQAQVKSVLEALSGQREEEVMQPSSIKYGLGSEIPPRKVMRKVPLNPQEIDQRLGQWVDYKDVLQQAIMRIQTSKEEQDALQTMFQELAE